MSKLIPALALLPLCLVAADPAPPKGVVVSVSPDASRAGEAVLAQGGNAVDAAVAVGFALAVTWPEAGNIGGGGFMLVRPAGDKSEPVVYDYRETAPKAATKNLFVEHGKKPHLTVGVPGSVAGLALAHQKHGKLPWKTLVASAIRLADDGFAIDAALASSLESAQKFHKDFPELKRLFANDKGKWKAGDRLVQKDLAKTLRRIADKGADGFYKGETAELLVKEMKVGKGLIAADDLTSYKAVVRKPIHGTYRGHEVYAPPPPSSGGVCLVLMLNVLENYDLKKHDRFSPETTHLMAEAMRRAYRDRALYLGDPAFVEIPGHLTTKAHAKRLAESIDPAKATPSVDLAKGFSLADEGESTTHYGVIDADGMAVSTTTTLENSFGSKLVVPGAGFLLNNEMTDFNPAPGVTTKKGQIGTEPNLIAPGKRMLSSMTPTMLVKGGKPVLITGSPGGRTIINTVANVVVGFVDYGMDVRSAVDAPRTHHQWFPDRLQVEAKLAAEHPRTVEGLKKRGHEVMTVRAQGDAHSIALDPKTKAYVGATDKRRAGVAAGFGDKK